MAPKLLIWLAQYAVYALEAGLVGYLCLQVRWKRLPGIFLYLVVLLAADGLGRPFVLYRYGAGSKEYAYVFWLTDVLLELALFLLVCSLFRRACAKEEKLWNFVRLLLFFVFILVLGTSFIKLSQNYAHLLSRFMIEFEQNLYFTCLVLTTLLYLLMAQIQSDDDELGLLVCGMGIQWAGPAASFALRHLTPGQPYSESLVKIVMPFCTLGMLLTWFYAVARAPKGAALSLSEGKEVEEVEAVVVSEA